jgi:phage-related protein
MAGEGETTFTAKIAADASQFRAELDAIVSKLQMMGGEVKNYTASMGSDFQAGFSNIIGSSSSLGEILQTFSDISTNAASVSADMQASFTTAFQGIQTSSVELKDFIQGVFDSVSKIQEQIAKLDPLKKATRKGCCHCCNGRRTENASESYSWSTEFFSCNAGIC